MHRITPYLLGLTCVADPVPAAAAELAGGGQHSWIRLPDGSLRTWGNNIRGQLRDGTTETRRLPTLVPGLTGVVAVAAGTEFTQALKADGSVWAWGVNDLGQLGHGDSADRSVSIQVSGLSGISAISAGARHALALHIQRVSLEETSEVAQ